MTAPVLTTRRHLVAGAAALAASVAVSAVLPRRRIDWTRQAGFVARFPLPGRSWRVVLTRDGFLALPAKFRPEVVFAESGDLVEFVVTA